MLRLRKHRVRLTFTTMPNHPKAGLTAVNVKLDEDLLARVDLECARRVRSTGRPFARTEAIRELIERHLPHLASTQQKRAKT